MKLNPRKKASVESGSPFDATKTRLYRKDAGRHSLSTEVIGDTAFSRKGKSTTTSPKRFLKKGSGHTKPKAKDPPSGKVQVFEKKVQKEKASITKRNNPPNTMFRSMYERGDLPIQISHSGASNKVQWKVAIDKLDFKHYLPIFFDGLREVEHPYAFLALEGAKDMINHGNPSKILGVIPQLILPAKTALNTRDKGVIIKTLGVLRKLVEVGADIGMALVPYYRQLLPVLNIFRRRNSNIGDRIEYSQRKGMNVGDAIQTTLEAFEKYGGPDAFINIKYLIPDWQSTTMM